MRQLGRRRRPGARSPLRRIALLAALATLVPACGPGGDGALDDALGSLPPEAPLVVAISTDADGEQLEALDGLLERLPVGKEVEDGIRAALAPRGTDFDSDRPLLGPRERGQTSAEYVGLILVLAAVVATSSIGEAVTTKVTRAIQGDGRRGRMRWCRERRRAGGGRSGSCAPAEGTRTGGRRLVVAIAAPPASPAGAPAPPAPEGEHVANDKHCRGQRRCSRGPDET